MKLRRQAEPRTSNVKTREPAKLAKTSPVPLAEPALKQVAGGTDTPVKGW